MWMPKSCGPEHFCRRRRYIGRYLIGVGVAAALIALCVGWMVYDVAAQTNDASKDSTLTVGECLSEVSTSVGPIGEALIKEDIIAQNLLPTKVTDGMCEDMLERAPDDTPVQTLVTAQNYIQEITLIENSIRQAEGKGTAKGNNPRPSGVAFILARATAETIEGPAQAQYPPRNGNSTATSTATPSPGGGGGGGGASGTTVSGDRRQAAQASAIAAATVAEGDASIADMLDQIEAASLKDGASRSEAAGSARCALEEALLNAISKELSQGQYIRVSPEPTPKEMEHGDTIIIKLLVSGDIRGLYEKLGRQYEKVEEASEAKDGCVLFNKSMEADLFDRRFTVDPHQGQEMRQITHDTTWSWDVTANTQGKNSVDLFVGHVLQFGELELKPQWVEPVPLRHAVIMVKARSLQDKLNFFGRNWLWLLPVGIALAVAATWLVGMLRKRAQRRPSEPADEG